MSATAIKRKRKAKVVVKLPIVYITQKGPVEYVSRTPSELKDEFARVQQSILDAVRMLHRMRRIRHPALITARFQLKHALRDLPADVTQEEVASEVGRLSYLMEDTLAVVDTLSNSRIECLEELRFKLRFGQSPKKRDINVYGVNDKDLSEPELREQDEDSEDGVDEV